MADGQHKEEFMRLNHSMLFSSFDRNLIYDLGMNHGEDSLFYLEKGFRVVAVEANPVIYSKMIKEFSNWIETGKLVILNVGIWDSQNKLTFYKNLDNDHWSSFDAGYGTRGGTRYEEVEIDCITLPMLLAEHGTPYYLKVDIEGADKIAISSLASADVLPAFVSVEEYGAKCIEDLRDLGYDRFKIVPQGNKSSMNPAPSPAREGTYVERWFSGRDTGLFGLELPGAWLPFQEAYSIFTSTIRDSSYSYIGPENEWFDVHATNTRVDGIDN
ncbi:FkbM family methyltransferase [Rhizobium freirei]|nr:FkbM family methyltransferase [Rhizobium freirei]